MSLADELSGAFGGGGGGRSSKRRGAGGGRAATAAARRQYSSSSDDDDDNRQQQHLSDDDDGGSGHLANGIDGGASLGAELADWAAGGASSSSRRGAKRSMAKSSAGATTGHDGGGSTGAHRTGGALSDDLDALTATADGSVASLSHRLDSHDDGTAAKGRTPSGGATYVQEADPLVDPAATPAGSAEAELASTAEQTCAALADVVASTDAFLARLRTLTTTNPTTTASTAAQQSISGDDTARLESFAATLLRSLRDAATQREQQVRDLREVDRHMARAEAAEPDFLARLADADEQLNEQADEAEAAAQEEDEEEDQGQTQGTTPTWAEARRRARRREASTASADTERGGGPSSIPQPVAPRVSFEPFLSEVTDTLATLLQRSVTAPHGALESNTGANTLDSINDDDEDDAERADRPLHSGYSDDDDEDEYNVSGGPAAADRSLSLDVEDELLEPGAGAVGWDDPTYRGSRGSKGSASATGARGTVAGAGAGMDAIADLSTASATTQRGRGGGPGTSTCPPTLPALRHASSHLTHSLSSLHETAQEHRATLSLAERRLRALRLLLDAWRDEVVAARRSRAWIARWEGRTVDEEDLIMVEETALGSASGGGVAGEGKAGSDVAAPGRVDNVLAASLAALPSDASSSGAATGRYTAGSGISPGAYAQEQLARFERLLAEAEERAKALLTPLPLPHIASGADAVAAA